MNRSRCLRIALLAALLSPAAVFAQAAGPAAVIEYASGDDVTVIRGSRPVPMADPFGFELFVGDQVQTGRGVFIELRMTAGDAVLKLAENTTFVIQKAEAGQTTLALIYGRVRAKVEKLAGTDSFSVTGGSAVAGVRGTDFGMDIVSPRGAIAAAPVTKVYCFEGVVDVTALIDTATSVAEALEPVPKKFTITAGEMVTVNVVDDKRDARKTGLEEPIRSYWTGNDFTDPEDAGIAPPPSSTVPEPAAPVPAVTAPEPVASGPGTQAAGMADGAALERAFEDGWSSGYGKGFLEGRSALATDPVAVEEAARVRSALLRQKGGLLAGGLVAVAGATLSGIGLAFLGSGETLSGGYLLRMGVVLSGVAVPFLVVAISMGD